MHSIAVLIIAPEDDLHAVAVMHALEKQGLRAEWANLGALDRELRLTLALDARADARLRTIQGDAIALRDVNTVWWRRPRRPVDDPSLDEMTRTFVRGEWDHFIDALETFTSVRWVNPPAAHLLAARKPSQLVAAQVEGLRVPRTRITNDPDAVRDFASQGFPLIYKRIGTSPEPRASTKPLMDSDLDRLDVLCHCPTMFQERIEARCDIRVTAIGPDLYAAEIDSQAGASPLDWRFDHTVKFSPHTLDSTVGAQLLATLKRLGLLYAAIDLRQTPEGEYVFLEVNPGGQFMFVELLAKMPLAEHLAAFLARDHRVNEQRELSREDGG
jgi:glutathione synthase/RimK-type ligase-like ATP-grasp enzyme